MVIDFTTITLVVAALMGLIAGDIAFYGNTLWVALSVPPKLAETGFTSTAAEYTFMGEASRITYVGSAFPTPELRINSAPTVISTVTKALGLEGLAGTIAAQTGARQMWVLGAVLVSPPGTKLELAMMVTQPGEAAQQIRVVQENGDAIDLVRRGAALALEELSPYRVALANYAKGIRGDAAALAQARETVTRDLAKHWIPAKASERAMEHNLLALLALHDRNIAAAQQELEQAAAINGVNAPARALINLNRAFVAVASKQPALALDFFHQAKETASSLTAPDIEPRIKAIEALVLWSNGDLQSSEKLMREVVAERPHDEGGRTYLSRLLALKGDVAGSAAEQQAAAASRFFDPHIMDLAQSSMWTDPLNGGVQPRN